MWKVKKDKANPVSDEACEVFNDTEFHFASLQLVCIWQLNLVVVCETVVLNPIEFELYKRFSEVLGLFYCCVCAVCDRQMQK